MIQEIWRILPPSGLAGPGGGCNRRHGDRRDAGSKRRREPVALLPVTTSMEPVAALVMLMAIYGGHDRRFHLGDSSPHARHAGQCGHGH